MHEDSFIFIFILFFFFLVSNNFVRQLCKATLLAGGSIDPFPNALQFPFVPYQDVKKKSFSFSFIFFVALGPSLCRLYSYPLPVYMKVL